MQTLQAIVLAIAVASAFLFALVGRTIQKRRVSPEARPANSAFVTWWYALAATTVVGLVMTSGLLPEDLALFLALTLLTLVLICLALWGLMFYLVYLFTEKRGAAVPLAVAYLAYFMLFVYLILAAGPTGIKDEGQGPQLDLQKADQFQSGPLMWLLVATLLVPPILCAIGYLSLYWKVDDRMQKRRILLVSLSIVAWFGTSALPALAGAQGNEGWWPVFVRGIGLLAASVIYYAYTGIQPGGEAKPVVVESATAHAPDAPAPPRRETRPTLA